MLQCLYVHNKALRIDLGDSGGFQVAIQDP